MNLKRIGQLSVPPLVTFGVFGLTLGYLAKRDSQCNKASETSMKYVKQHNPNKYYEILEKGIDKKTPMGCKVWEQAAKDIYDSLRIDSVAKTNYAKGAQMIQDVR